MKKGLNTKIIHKCMQKGVVHKGLSKKRIPRLLFAVHFRKDKKEKKIRRIYTNIKVPEERDLKEYEKEEDERGLARD